MTASQPGDALGVTEGERRADEFLARPQGQQADSGELALVMAALRGFRAAIVKALRRASP